MRSALVRGLLLALRGRFALMRSRWRIVARNVRFSLRFRTFRATIRCVRCKSGFLAAS